MSADPDRCPDCEAATGGVCREHYEPECTCFELFSGVGGTAHQQGCYFYGLKGCESTSNEKETEMSKDQMEYAFAMSDCRIASARLARREADWAAKLEMDVDDRRLQKELVEAAIAAELVLMQAQEKMAGRVAMPQGPRIVPAH